MAMDGDGFVQALQEIVDEFTQAAVAQKAGLSQGTISKLLHGKTQGGHAETVRKLISAYPDLRRFFVPGNIPNGMAL